MRMLRTPREEYRQRQLKLYTAAANDGYDGVILFGTIAVEYITGMYHLPTERPVAVGITQDEVHAVVPELERAHAENEAFAIDEVHCYFDYPQGKPMSVIASMCSALGIDDGLIVADSDGSPERNGYVGPSLSSLIPGEVTVHDYVTTMREQKSSTEIELVAEASQWANVAHQILQDKIEVGRRPVIISQEVKAEATKALLDTLGDKYEMTTPRSPVTCKFTTGDVTFEPHSVDQTTPIERGDNIVSIVKANIGGYQTELERTMFVGGPNSKQRHFFKIMSESQSLAIEALEPGVEYAEVERVVVDFYEEMGVMEFAQHHIGHNIGLDFHERPFLDVGYEGTLSEGELYTVEPGLFVPDVGGFRHSDTVVVTEDGAKELTYYPKDIESLTIDI